MAGALSWASIRQGTAYLRCRQGPRAFCVGQIDLERLAQIYLAGVLHVITAPCNCGNHAEGAGRVIGQFNDLIRVRGLPEINHREVAVEIVRNGAGETVDGARRGFLRRVSDVVVEDEEAAEDPPALAAILAFGAEDPNVPYPWVPVFDADLCTGCNGCINVCPEDSLILITAEDGTVCYGARPETCNGCELCMSVCEYGAIELRGMTARSPDIPLASGVCRACGVDYHEPAGRESASRFCPVCRRTGHHRKLFQVIQ